MPSFQRLKISIIPSPIHYEILISKDFFNHIEFKEALERKGKHVAIFIEEKLEKIVKKIQKKFSFPIPYMPLPGGEALKCRAWKEKIEEFLLKHQFQNDCMMIAIGGGALLDLIGFVAATYARGVPYISIPTTLLAMTDAAIGGKTAINVSQAKNFLGSFHHPSQIFIDLNLLKKLPLEEFWNGFSETIKHALIADEALFSFLEKNFEKIVEQDEAILEEIISASCRIKCQIVQEDPYEKLGKRSLLNFGHTIGHALETLSGFTLKHGDAVLKGMLIEAWISKEIGNLPQKDYDRLYYFLTKIPCSSFSLLRCDEEQWNKVFAFDKKNRQGVIRIVSLKKIGQACLIPIDPKMLHRGVQHALCSHQDALF